MKYTPQILMRKNGLGTRLHVGILYDNADKTYVAEIRSGAYRKMADGTHKQPLAAIGEGESPTRAADAAIDNWNAEWLKGVDLEELRRTGRCSD